MTQPSLLASLHIPDPEVAKRELKERLAARRAQFAAAPAPAPETFIDSREGVVVKFDDLPEFFQARGVTRVTVDFPTFGPYAGQMVVRRAG